MDTSQAIEAPSSLYSTSYTTTATPFSTPNSHFVPRPPPPSPASPESATTPHSRDIKLPMTSSRQDNYRTPPSFALRQFNSNYSSDEASEDGDDVDVPPTPGDIDAFQPISLVPYIRGGGGGNTRGGVELSKLFGNGIGSNTATIQDDGSLSLSPVANVFYPSFGDFLPAVKKQKEVFKANALGLSDWDEPIEEKSTSDRIESLSASLSHRLALRDSVEEVEIEDEQVSRVASPVTGQSVFAPFASFSPNTDSFAFFPSPDWKASNRGVDATTKKQETTLTSSSLLSPEPNLSLPTFPMQRSLSSSHVESSRSHIIVTPPSTPTRNTSYHTAPSMQPSRSLPIPTAFSPTRSQFGAPAPTRMSFPQSPGQHGGGYPSSTYPLSPADTERIAKLHNGRIPTLEQLCPEPAHPSAQPPIVNTGNQGVMVVQQGDWKCGTCSFVNWRRRKICLRCFPFANDIGNILTIQSQRAAHLAGPPPPLSAPAHQTNFLLPSPTRGHFDPCLSPSGMARSSSNSPDVLSQRRSSSPYTQAYLVVPPPPPPQSASPTRSTFALHHQPPPASPTRYMHSPLSSHSTPPKSNMPPYLYPEEDRSPTRLSASSSVSSSYSANSAGELAMRRSAKLQRLSPSATNYKSLQIQPLNLTGYAAQPQPQSYSPTFHRSPSYYQPPRESPPSPTRYLSHRSGGDELTRMLGAEL